MLGWLSTILMAVGIAVGAIAAAKPAGEENWFIFGAGVVVIIIGAIVRYFARKEETRKLISAAEGKFGKEEISQTLNGLPEKLRAILAKFDDSNETVDTLHKKVDEFSKTDIFNIVEYRLILERICGIKEYPFIFSMFSEGERLVNRAWSALCDKHKTEAKNSLQEAIASFENAKTEFEKLKTN